jgi:hypothetical protein
VQSGSCWWRSARGTQTNPAAPLKSCRAVFQPSRCKEVGGLLKYRGVTYVCLPQWEKAA